MYLSTLPRKRMGAGVLCTDPHGRVLLVEPTYKPNWEIPGGVVEADESPYAATAREVEEELGLELTPGRLLVVDWVPPQGERTEGIMFVYDGGVLGPSEVAALRLPAEELAGWAFCSPNQVRQRANRRLAGRVEAAITARAGGATAYLEGARPVG